MKTTPALPEWCWKSYLGHGLLDADGAWICLNPALCYLFQRPAGEFLGRRLDEILGESSREIFRKAWEDVVSGALPSRCMDLEFPAPDGGRLFTDAFLTKFEEVPGAMMLQILNITRHKETESELAAAKRRLHLTAAVAGMGFWEYDFQTTAQNWDDGVFRIYGIKREDFSGRWDTYVHPEDIERSHQTVLDTIEKSDSGEQDFRAVLPDGSIRHVHSIFTVDRDAEGKPLRLTGINFDITDSVEGREAEARNEASLRMILDNLPIPVTTSRTTGNGEITLINKEFTRLLGYTAEDAQTIKRLVELNFPDPEIQAQGMAWWRDLIAHSKENPTPAREVPFQVKSKAGEFRDLLANATVVDDTLILASHDITERQAAETKLQEIRKTLERILEDMPVPVMVIDADPAFEDRRFLMANRKFTEILGYTLEDMPSAMAWAAKAYPEEEYRKMVVDWWRDALANAANKNKPIENVEFFVMGKDGVTRDILFHTTLVGGLIVIAMQDVTEQKKAAAELEKEGIDVEILDLRTIRPMDTDAIIRSVMKTGRCVTIEEGYPQSGVGAEIVARIMERAFDYLDAPPTRVHQVDAPLAYAANLEALALQNQNAIGAGFAYPVTMEQVGRWARDIESRGYQLAPASAVLNARASGR